MRLPTSVRKNLNIAIDWLHVVNVLFRSKRQQAIKRHRKLILACLGVWLCSIAYFAFGDPWQKFFFPPIWWVDATCFVAGTVFVLSYGFAACASEAVEDIHWLRDKAPRLKYALHVAAAAWLATEPDEDRGALLCLLPPDFDSRPVEERHAMLARAAGTLRHHHELALAEIIGSL